MKPRPSIRRLSVGLVLLASALLGARASGAQIGSVLAQHKVSATAGGFALPLSDFDHFGQALAPLGDLDGDGVVDLAVGAPLDSDGGPYRGAVWILFLEHAGRVRTATKLGSLGGFPQALADQGRFGASLAPLGDMDGDGIVDLAIGAPGVQTVWFCMLRTDGTVRAATKTSDQDSVYSPPLAPGLAFGYALAPLGDIDGNGTKDLGVTAPGASTSGGTGSSIWLLRLTRFGAVAGAQLAATSLGGTGPLAGRRFGLNLAVADMDGDADIDLVTSTFLRIGPTSEFQLLTLLLDANRALAGIDEALGPELGTYLGLPQDALGLGGLAVAGDLDGDGGLELFLGAPLWRGSTTSLRRGAVVLGFTRPVGPARRRVLVSSNRGGLVGLLPEGCHFGESLALLGDLDGDGAGDLAVGAPQDGDGGPARGAVWLLNLDGSPLRDGSGANPRTLSEVAPPVMNHTWQLDLDCAAHVPGFALLAGYAGAQPGLPSPAGEVLIDPASGQLFRFVQAHGGGVSRFSLAVPVDAALISLPLHVQGLCAGAPGPQLGNALDEILSVP